MPYHDWKLLAHLQHWSHTYTVPRLCQHHAGRYQAISRHRQYPLQNIDRIIFNIALAMDHWNLFLVITLPQWVEWMIFIPDVYMCYEEFSVITWSGMGHIPQHPMMTSSNENITGPLWGESTSHLWIPLMKVQWCGALMFSLICAWTNSWANNRAAGDLRHLNAHYDVIVMLVTHLYFWDHFIIAWCHGLAVQCWAII